jgi:hypothetical protein
MPGVVAFHKGDVIKMSASMSADFFGEMAE